MSLRKRIPNTGTLQTTSTPSANATRVRVSCWRALMVGPRTRLPPACRKFRAAGNCCSIQGWTDPGRMTRQHRAMTMRRAFYSLGIIALAFSSIGGDCYLDFSGSDCSPSPAARPKCDPIGVGGVRHISVASGRDYKWVCEAQVSDPDAGVTPCSDAGTD